MILSLIIPCYNEEGNVQKFFDCTEAAFGGKVDSYEYVFVNDGSSDKTQEKLRKLHNEHKDKVQVISFSRNFGKESAIYAGLKSAKGDMVCLIDADLQQRPEVVLRMLDVINSNDEIDCVTAYQEKRHENKLVAAIKSVFYKLINKLSDFVNGASDFRLLKRNMVDAILKMTEFYRFSKGIFSWVGFNVEYIPYEACERESGETKWGVRKLFKYALDGIYAFSTAPLKFSTIIGFLMGCCSILYLFVVVLQKLCFGIDVPGYATIIVLLLLIGGSILFSLGIIGEYLAKMYIEVKNRPIYLTKEHLKNDED